MAVVFHQTVKNRTNFRGTSFKVVAAAAVQTNFHRKIVETGHRTVAAAVRTVAAAVRTVAAADRMKIFRHTHDNEAVLSTSEFLEATSQVVRMVTVSVLGVMNLKVVVSDSTAILQKVAVIDSLHALAAIA
jgi:hypothetical protein